MDGTASISAEILGRYAADAAREIDGVRTLHGRHAVKVGDDRRVEVHVEVEWGASIPTVGKSVQERVREYLLRMADVEPTAVEVVVDEIGPR
ncbi:MAG: Asp23/Gls24 family envelope stress response protein [Gaiellaceae bacterium]